MSLVFAYRPLELSRIKRSGAKTASQSALHGIKKANHAERDWRKMAY